MGNIFYPVLNFRVFTQPRPISAYECRFLKIRFWEELTSDKIKTPWEAGLHKGSRHIQHMTCWINTQPSSASAIKLCHINHRRESPKWVKHKSGYEYLYSAEFCQSLQIIEYLLIAVSRSSGRLIEWRLTGSCHSSLKCQQIESGGYVTGFKPDYNSMHLEGQF